MGSELRKLINGTKLIVKFLLGQISYTPTATFYQKREGLFRENAALGFQGNQWCIILNQIISLDL